MCNVNVVNRSCVGLIIYFPRGDLGWLWPPCHPRATLHLGLHNSQMITVKERKLKYFGHNIRKSVSVDKDIV